MSAERSINGTYGRVWVDGELWAEVETFEATATPEYEDVNQPGSGATYRKLLGWNGEGSMTIRKVFSRVQRKMANSIKNGITPRAQIVGKLEDPDSYGRETAVLNDVTFNQFDIMRFEQKTVVREDLSFNFSDYDLPDLIEG